MKYIVSILITISSLFFSGCFFQEEEIRESITGGKTPKEIYIEGQFQLEGGQLDEAAKTFDKLQAAYPASKYSLQSKIDIIYAMYEKERFDDAIDSLNEYIKLYPNHFSTPYAYYLKAVSAEDKSKSILDEYITDNAERDTSSVKNAFNYYMELINKFPDSEYAKEAKDKLVVIRNILARHELSIAIFYTKINAHIGAVNRCKFIIEKFPNTPSVPAALHLMAYNYEKLGSVDLSQDASRVLQNSYPKYIPHYTLED